jgi:hypothetical protein
MDCKASKEEIEEIVTVTVDEWLQQAVSSSLVINLM